MTQIKQVLIIRKDLKMRRGKECAQCSHASNSVLLKQKTKGLSNQDGSSEVTLYFNEDITSWLTDSLSTKITVSVNSEQELLNIYKQAQEAGLPCSLIKDAGLTEFKEPTFTVVAIGPAKSEEINKITGKLPLY